MENKIYVAVGKEVEERISTLDWVLKFTKGETICVIHVHVPSRKIRHSSDGFRSPLRAFREGVIKALERKKVAKNLDDYLKMFSLNQVPFQKIIIEKDSVTDGLLELISQLRIRKLVMGAGANNHYLRRYSKPASTISNYVLQCAPEFCHIWFIWKGRPIYTREGFQHTEEYQSNSLNCLEPILNSPFTESAGSSTPLAQSTQHSLSPVITVESDDYVEIVLDLNDNGEIQVMEITQEPSSSNVPTFSYELSQLDIEEATNFFDSCMRIKEGYNGNIYKAFLKQMMTPCESLCSSFGDKVPSYFICPILQEIMQDPHIAGDGHTYEADAIKEWFKGGHDTSPMSMTNLKLDTQNLAPNRALRSAIQDWLQQRQHVI